MTSGVYEIDCQEAARHLHELIDGELTPEVDAAVQNHLKTCAKCMNVYEFEQAFCRFVKLKASSQTAPSDLKQHILESLGLTGDSEGK